MKVTLKLMRGDAEIEWDTSMGDDPTEVHKVALAISKKIEVQSGCLPIHDKEGIVRNYIFDNQKNLDYECGVCAANEKTNVSPEQTGLFEDEDEQ